MGDPAMDLISADAATRKAGIDYVKRCIDFSEALGAKFLSGPLHSTLGQFSGIRSDRGRRRSARSPRNAPSATMPARRA